MVDFGIDHRLELESSRRDTAEMISEQDFYLIYRNFSRRVFGLYRGKGYSRSTAEDLVQLTFMEVWKGRERFDPNRGGLERWILSIARNVGFDFERRRHADKRGYGKEVSLDGKLEESPRFELASDDPDPERMTITAENLEEFRQCLEQLGSRMRNTYLMADYLEPGEIARTLRIAPATVRSNLSQARAKLLECLKRSLEPRPQ